MAASSEQARSSKTSKHLLYSENFKSGLEDKLKIKKIETGPRKTFRPPPSSVLGRLEAFLPNLAASNAELLAKPANEVNIENISDEHDGPLIKMEFALVPGVVSSSDESSDESSDNDDEHLNKTSGSRNPSLSSELRVPAVKLNDQKDKIVCLSSQENDNRTDQSENHG